MALLECYGRRSCDAEMGTTAQTVPQRDVASVGFTYWDIRFCVAVVLVSSLGYHMNLSAERRRSLTAKAKSLTDNIEQALPYLLSRGISREVANMFGLGFVPKGQEYGGRLSIPYWTPAGVVQVKYRCVEHESCKGIHNDKYLYEAGLGQHLYNAQVLVNAADAVVVTEGELDAICVQAYCGYPAVAYPGADTWQNQQHWRLCFEGVSEVIVVADGDDVGRKAATRVAESIGIHARVVSMPDGFDANLFIAQKGAMAFNERIAE